MYKNFIDDFVSYPLKKFFDWTMNYLPTPPLLELHRLCHPYVHVQEEEWVGDGRKWEMPISADTEIFYINI